MAARPVHRPFSTSTPADRPAWTTTSCRSPLVATAPANSLPSSIARNGSADYIAQGVTAIEIDLNNFSKVDLNIRLGFRESTDPGASGYLSTAFSLSAGSGWQHAVFLINPGSMIAVGSPADFNTFFAGNFGEMRIINEAGTSNLNGDQVTAEMGIDNIHAVPEPSAVLLSMLGALSFVVCRRNKRR